MKGKYVAPSFEADAFHCPHCEAFAHQKWFFRTITGTVTSTEGKECCLEGLSASMCSRCDKYALWLDDERMIYPVASIAPLPAEDMPDDVKDDFMEARNIVNTSPRATVALLRLALQKPMVHLGERGEKIDDDIKSLVAKGLPERIQKALDAVRVIGNNAVHPGEIDLKTIQKQLSLCLSC